MHDIADLESRGLPGVGVASSEFVQAAAAQAKKTGKPLDSTKLAQESAETTARITAQFEKQSDVLYSSARLWDDGIIDPRDTRRVLLMGLMAAAERPLNRFAQPVYRM